MSNFETAPYRLASAINDLASRVLELEAFDNAIFEIKTTTGRPTARGNYHFVINTFDDTVEIYADGAWEDLIGAGGGGYTDEEAQDAVGTILTDTATIDFTYDDATPEITADVIPGGVDHDSLLNFVANEHIDHTSVTLTAGSHLTGGGDISANRTFDVDDDFVLNTGDQVDGNLIIDQTDQEAFLIRKDADAGDLFIADTTDMQVGIGGTPAYQLHILQLQDAEALWISGYDDKSAEYLRAYVAANGDGYMLSSDDMFIRSVGGSITNILGDDAGAKLFRIMDSAFAVVATIDSDGRISSGGAIDTNYGITVRQLADGDGIVIYGYDDESAQFLRMFINSAGSGYIQADEELILVSDTSYILLDSAGNTYLDLGDTSGVNKVSIRDSGSAEVAYIDSDGEAGLKQLVFTDGGSTVDIIRDEDDMASDDAAALATQQSIKAYIDSLILANVGNCSIETGTYTGDGATSQVISLSNANLEVKYVTAIWRETATAQDVLNIWSQDNIVDDNASGMAMADWFSNSGGAQETQYSVINRIIALGTGSFTVDDAGSNQHPNKSGITYNYMVLGIPTGSGSPAFMETGTYTGDGSTSQVISLDDTSLIGKKLFISERETAHVTRAETFFTSDTIVDDNASGYCFEFHRSSAAASEYTTIGLTDHIIALGTGSFTVDDAGSDVHPNKNGAVYNYTIWGTH